MYPVGPSCELQGQQAGRKGKAQPPKMPPAIQQTVGGAVIQPNADVDGKPGRQVAEGVLRTVCVGARGGMGWGCHGAGICLEFVCSN